MSVIIEEIIGEHINEKKIWWMDIVVD